MNSTPPKYYRWIILGLCLFAGLRILIFSAALPFFANTDELSHYDTVYKWAHGDAPRRLTHHSPGSVRQAMFFRSLEFINPPNATNSQAFKTPLWSLPNVASNPIFLQRVQSRSADVNIEAVQPPPYYILQAGWYRVGWSLGLRGGWLLYWLRFLNAGIFAALIPLGYLLARELYSERPFVYLGTAILLAVFPQDIFFTLNNDVLAPTASALALLVFVLLLRTRRPMWMYLLAGALIGVAALVKLTNVVLFIPVALLLAARGKRTQSIDLKSWVSLAVTACVPYGIWMTANYLATGDPTNSTAKVAYLTWIPKSVSQIGNHPIFTGAGFWYFWRDFTANYWGGEIVWHTKSLSPPWLDLTYLFLTTVVLVTIPLAALRTKTRDRQNDLALFAYVLSGIGILILLSIRWDFNQSPAPSPEQPYFTSGRLIMGTLVPFVIITVRAMDILLARLKQTTRLGLLGALALTITIGQGIAYTPTFGSAFNWFHLRQPADPTVLLDG